MQFDFRPVLLLNRAGEAGLRNVKIAPTSVLVCHLEHSPAFEVSLLTPTQRGSILVMQAPWRFM